MLVPVLLQLCALMPAVSPVAADAWETASATATAEAPQGQARAMAIDLARQQSDALRTPPAAPRGLVLLGPPATAQGRLINRSADGLFYVTATVNGAPVRFLVDTGATMVVLRPEDAQRAGIALEDDHYTASAETANGRTAMARVTLNELVVGDKRTRGIDAAVVSGDLPVSLLGQNWLSRLDSLTIAGDRLLFN